MPLRTLLWAMAGMQLLYLTGRSALQPERASIHLGFAALVIGAALLVQLAPERWLDAVIAVVRRAGIFAPAVLLLVAGLVYALFRGTAFADEAAGFEVAILGASQGLGAMLSQWTQLPWVGTQHPPLVLILQALLIKLAAPQIVWARLVGLLFGCGVVAATAALGRRWYGSEVALLAALLLLSIRIFFRSSASGNLDVPLTFFFMLLLLATQPEDPPPYRVVLAGIALGLGLLTKYTMLLAGPALAAAWLASGQLLRRLRRAQTWMAGGIGLLVIAPWLLFLWRSGFLEQQAARVSEHAAITTTHRWSGLHYTFDDLAVHFPATFGGHLLLLVVLGLWRLWRRRGELNAARFHLGAIAGWSAVLLATHAEPRYFLPLHPLLALAAAGVVAAYPPAGRGRILILAVALTAISLALVIASGDPVR